jgi:hypothetical protein
MTVIIKSTENKEKIKKNLKNLERKGKLDAFKHCRKVKLKEDPLKLQKMMRSEW